jgi:hypothetical protein
MSDPTAPRSDDRSPPGNTVSGPPGAYAGGDHDEMRAADGTVREGWAALAALVHRSRPAALAAATRRLLADEGVTYRPPGEHEQPWALDPLPLPSPPPPGPSWRPGPRNGRCCSTGSSPTSTAPASPCAPGCCRSRWCSVTPASSTAGPAPRHALASCSSRAPTSCARPRGGGCSATACRPRPAPGTPCQPSGRQPRAGRRPPRRPDPPPRPVLRRHAPRPGGARPRTRPGTGRAAHPRPAVRDRLRAGPAGVAAGVPAGAGVGADRPRRPRVATHDG